VNFNFLLLQHEMNV